MFGITANLIFDPPDHKYDITEERMKTLLEDLTDWCMAHDLCGGFKFTKVCDTCGEVVPYGKIFCPKCEKYIESDKAYSEQRKNLQSKTRR